MRKNGVFGEFLPENVGQSFRHPPGVHEDQGGLVFLDEGGDPVPDVLHYLVGSHRAEFGVRNLHRQVEFAPVADGNHRRALRRARTQEVGDLGERPHGSREPDALERAAGEPVQTFEGEREVAAPLVAGERVDFVHDDGVRVLQEFPAARRGQEQVERFRGGDQDVGRLPGHAGPVRGRGVAGPEFGADRGQRGARRLRSRGDAGEREFQVPADVRTQRLERRDIDHAGLVRQCPASGFPGEPVQREEERRERLSGTRRGGNQDILAPGDGRPPPCLGLRGSLEPLPEPASDGRIELGERRGHVG